MAAQYEYFEKRMGPHNKVEVIGWKRMQESSVLAGQLVKCFVGSFDNEDQAEAVYGQMNWYNRFTAPSTSVAHLPGEDDPVPGGMYPDDGS